MRSFEEIRQIAAHRKGGADALEALLPPYVPQEVARAIPEDRWLSWMTRCIFQAGFNWKVIEAKWDGFETAFHGFDIARCAFMPEEESDALLSDTRVVRNGAKLAAVRENAAFLLQMRDQGGAGEVLGGWPAEDYAGLLDHLKKNGARLGGNTGQYAMRFAGRDGYVLSADVIARLQAEGVIDGAPTSKRAMAAVQAAFNTWRAESGRGLTQISRVLAMSV